MPEVSMNPDDTPAKVQRTLCFERGIEPSSGQPVVLAGGMLPDVPAEPAARVEILFDGRLKSWMPLRPPDPPDVGSRFNLQVLEEPGLESVRVVLRRPTGDETLMERALQDMHRRGP